jgi:hypothetical protein
MATELNENMTSEEIAAYADAVAKEVEAERQGDKKSDAEIVAGTSQPTSTRAEDNTGGESTKAESQGEESGDTAEAPEWVTDDVKAEVATYGISEEDLLEFSSREELDKVLRILDKKAFEAGKNADSESDGSTTRNEKGQFVKKEESQGDDTDDSASESGYEVSLSSELWDEEIIGEFNKMKDYYESRLSKIEERFQEVAIQAEEQQFDNFVDSLGHADLFGKTGKETKEELERRRELNTAVKAQILGLQKLGNQAELNKQLVERVANMVFAEELGKKRLKQHTSKLAKQSNLRQGGSPTKPIQAKDDPRDEFDKLYQELSRK